LAEPRRVPRAKIDGLSSQRIGPAMDIERINLIGTLLADLSTRTAQLRGYL